MKKLLFFSAPWCTRCASVKRKLTESQIPFVEIDVEMNDDLVKKFNIATLPTLVDEDTGERFYLT